MKVHAVILAARFGRGSSPALAPLWARLEAHPDITCDFHGSMAWDELIEPLTYMRSAGLLLAVIGYSLGGMRAVELCNALADREHDTKVHLLATIVPPKGYIQWNVQKCINHTVSGGHFWNWASDNIYAAEPRRQGRIQNIDYWGWAGVSHYAIQTYPAVHSSIYNAVVELTK